MENNTRVERIREKAIARLYSQDYSKEVNEFLKIVNDIICVLENNCSIRIAIGKRQKRKDTFMLYMRCSIENSIITFNDAHFPSLNFYDKDSKEVTTYLNLNDIYDIDIEEFLVGSYKECYRVTLSYKGKPDFRIEFRFR